MLKEIIVSILALITLATCAPQGKVKPNDAEDKIMGGEQTTIEEYPHQLALRDDGYQICGASIIHVNWALTAAHCVFGTDPKRLSLKAGSTSRSSTTTGKIHQVASKIVHSKYKSNRNDFGVALLKVTQAFTLTGSVAKIGLPDKDTEIAAGTMLTVSGWGTLNSGGPSLDMLRKVSIPVVSNVECNKLYNGKISIRMLCAGISGKDSCQGDSGGPLIVTHPQAGKQLIGVVSWGIGCGKEQYPGVYANVSSFVGWIKTNIKPDKI